MSSTASELNALGTVTSLDLYKRNIKGEFTQAHYVKGFEDLFTPMWGAIAISIATCCQPFFDNLDKLVNS